MGYGYDNPEETKTTAKITADVVCPVCFGPLPHAQIVTQNTDEHGNTIRTYFGWCFECERGYAVIQFAKEQRWVIHKYKEYSLSGQTIEVCGLKVNKCKPQDEWTVLTDLPRPAPVVLGPGGDYKKEITPELSTFFDKLKFMRDSVGNLLKSINELLNENNK